MRHTFFILIFGFSLSFTACDDSPESKKTCEEIECGDHGTCDASSGGAVCICEDGFDGDMCNECAEGYQDNDENGSCLETCSQAGYTCSSHGSCTDVSGLATCNCDSGYIHDGNGNCIEGGSGDSCNSPLLLTLGTEVSGNTYDMPDNTNGSCAESSSGGETIYIFNVTQESNITFETDGFDTVLFIRTDCDDINSEIACDDDEGPQRGSRIEGTFEPGTYFLYVDSYTESGNYTLTTEVECPAGLVFDAQTGNCVEDPCDPNPCTDEHKTTCNALLPSYTCSCDPGYVEDPLNNDSCIINPNPQGESCVDPIELTGLTGSVSGSTTDASGEITGSCGGQGADRVYFFTTSEQMRVRFSSSGFDTVLYIRTDCTNPSSEISCNDEGGGEWGSSEISTTLEPGTYFLIVDSWDESGDYNLFWSMAANPCADEETACPGTPVCLPTPDWTNFTCSCPEGTLPYNNDCVDDPCDPNPCSQAGRGRCVRELDIQSYTCSCEVGFMDDSGNPGLCVEDPSAADWAFIVYLNADNNLEADGITDMNEMKAVGSTGSLDIVVLLDLVSVDGGITRSLYVENGSETLLINHGELDLSNWQTLRDFGTWAVENYPARHYAFIMWDHGNGWYKSNAPVSPLFKGFSNDDNGTAGEISIANGDYAKAMGPITTSIGRKIDILAFDACLMGMWEVAVATEPFADYFVASEETIPLTGYSYDDLLAPLAADTSISPVTLAQGIIETYYNEKTDNSTLSLTDLGSLSILNSALSDFAQAMMNHPTVYNQIETARSNTISYSYGSHIDLADFASRVSMISGIPSEITTAASAVVTAVETVVLYNRFQSDYTGSHGLAIYLPGLNQGADSTYQAQGAVWSAISSWDEFVMDFAN
ncbi:hypothetical protein KKF34_15545 [Myxococcota bacterium]|nr:hypothetical protein [Myxococcota bacterium]MBU1382733.1 hypothetical protein [Myxococcota bacterium]MBU1498289.1 hypothetical protein [Myxococcota bacterium]